MSGNEKKDDPQMGAEGSPLEPRPPSTSVEAILQARAKLEQEQAALDKMLMDEFHKNVTVMFTDIKGSTSFFETYGDLEGRAMVERHNLLLFPFIAKHGGKVIKTIGDAIMATFESPAEGVRAACEMQASLKVHNDAQDQKHKRLLVRIGLNYGAAVVEEKDVTGDAVNVASRVESQADAEQILISEDLYKEVRGDADVLVRFFGDVTVKGKAEPVIIYRVVWDENEKTLPDLIKPFVPIDESFSQLRQSGIKTFKLFPSWREYLEGNIPELGVEQSVVQQLKDFGWAFILGLPSMGKTTLAIRLAAHTLPKTLGFPSNAARYLDVSDLNNDEELKQKALAVIQRISSSRSLIILDNVHHDTEFARSVYEKWLINRGGSRLLIIATQIQPKDTARPQHTLSFLGNPNINTSLKLEIVPNDLTKIMLCIAGRLNPNHRLSLPPPEKVKEWHDTFQENVSAFCVAVVRRLSFFSCGDWNLKLNDASDWVRDNWLDPRKINAKNIENQFCLAVFGDQYLNLKVKKEALPYPEEAEKLLLMGHVERSEKGEFGQFKYYSLRKPGWGELILSVPKISIDREKILFETAKRNSFMAILISSRLRRHGMLDRNRNLWKSLAKNLDQVGREAALLPLSYFNNFTKYAMDAGQNQLANRSWEFLENNKMKLIQYLRESPLSLLASFLDTAKIHRRDVNTMWNEIEYHPNEFSRRIYEGKANLGDVATFMKTAETHSRDLATLWGAIETNFDSLTESAWYTPLHFLAFFMDTAKEQTKFLNEETADRHREIIERLWRDIENNPDKLAQTTCDNKNNLGQLASFMLVAKNHTRDLNKLWSAIEKDLDGLTRCLWANSLADIALFMDRAKEQAPLLNDKTVARHELNLATLWSTIEKDMDKLIVCAWESPLDYLATFMRRANEQDRKLDPLWEALKKDPKRLARKIKNTGMRNLAGFFRDAPDEVISEALKHIDPKLWNESIRETKSASGAHWVAKKCDDLNCKKHVQAILFALFERSDPKDFSPEYSGFSGLAWLLWKINIADKNFDRVFTNICDKEWLNKQYKSGSLGALAMGLRLLAIHQTPDIINKFKHNGLEIRLKGSLAQFDCSPRKNREQSELVQFWGGVNLCGWELKSDWLKNVTNEQLAKLPVETQAHRPEAKRVETYQLQLWVGLRAIIAAKGAPLLLDPEVIDQTLALWRINLGQSSSDPASAEHRLNQDMVNWLEECDRAKDGRLLPKLLLSLWTS